MANEHDCKCADLPAVWGPCLRETRTVWSPGCDAAMQDKAREHLGFPTRLAFIEWAARQEPGRFGLISGEAHS